MGVKAIGVDGDQHDEMPGTVLTSMIKRADVADLRGRSARSWRAASRAASRRSAWPRTASATCSEGPHAAGSRTRRRRGSSALSARIARGELVVPWR